MENAKQQLSSFIWCYVILAGLTCLLIFSAITSPEIAERIVSSKYGNMDLEGISPVIILSISYGIEAIIYIINFLLLRNVVEGKSKGILISILLVIGIVLSFVDQFKGFNVSTLIGMLVDVYVLQLVYFVRKENNKKMLFYSIFF